MLFNLVVLLMVTFVYFYFPYYQNKYLREINGNEIQLVANSIAAGVGIALDEENFEVIASTLAYTQSDSRFEFVALYQSDTTYKINESQGRYTLYMIQPENYVIDGLPISNETVLIRQANFSSGLLNGIVLVGFSTSEIQTIVLDLKQMTLLVGVFVFLVVSLFSFAVTTTITKPLVKFMKATDEIGAGNMDIDIHVNI